MMFREGILVVVSGPSGAGKGTVLNVFKEQEKNTRFSISATTRKPRKGEVEGVNYFFKSNEEFERMVASNELVEWVKYCDNCYGTPKKYIDDTIKQGMNCLLEIEVEGALNIKKAYPDSVCIFLLPPSFEELKKRIEGRGTESPDIIAKRLEKAKREILFADRYDYIIINDDIENAVSSLRSILVAEKLKYKRNRDILKMM